jgi:hypothetical protein
MRYLIVLVILFTSKVLHADGIPVDSLGNITVQHFTVDLTTEQKESLEHSREISLTDAQQKITKKVWPFDKVDVLDPHHHDCTCGMFYAIWINPDQIAFLGDTSSVQKTDKATIEEQYEIYDESYVEDRSRYLYIGIRGDIYYKDRSVTSDSLKGVLQSILDKDEKDKYVIIYVAPKKGNSNWDKIKSAKAHIRGVIPEELYAVWM